MVGRHQGGASTVTSFATYNGTLNRILPMDFPIIINWVSPLSFLGVLGVIFILFIFLSDFFDEISLCKQNSPRWEAAFCGVTSWAMLFAYVPQKGRQA